MSDLSAFSLRLRVLREESGLNQGELAEKIGVSRGSISFYENGSRVPDISVLQKLCNEFGVSADFLIGAKEYKNDAVQKKIEGKLRYLERFFPSLGTEKHMQLIDNFFELVSCDPMVAGGTITGCLLDVLIELNGIADKYKGLILAFTLHEAGEISKGPESESDDEFEAAFLEMAKMLKNPEILRIFLSRHSDLKADAFEHAHNISLATKKMVDTLHEVIQGEAAAVLRKANLDLKVTPKTEEAADNADET